MANHTARLLQVHYAMHRAGAVNLIRMPMAALGGEAVKVIAGKPDEGRIFADATEAEAFIRQAADNGDVVGVACPKHEMPVLAQLAELALLLDSNAEVTARIIAPAGVIEVHFRADNLKHAAEVFGTATLFGLSVMLEQEVRE